MITAGRRRVDDLGLQDGYATLGEAYIERRAPTPLGDPYLVAFNPEVAELLELAPVVGSEPDLLAVLAGNSTPAGADPWAAVYAGHQFGTYVPQLGDGRAITLGEVENARGERWEWQLKGAGTTAYSRFGDGRAVLRSSVREYLCSEAMHHLGIPTTRALAVAGSNDPVMREELETAAVLSRVAPSHLRFGTFEFFHYVRDFGAVKTIADYAIARFFPEIDPRADERYAQFLREVARRTARLVARWQAVGFAHGVMNTDNFSILGITLDYGPYGFMEAYDPAWICNHSDSGGRYAFERQPGVALWNCHAFAAALSSLVSKPDAGAALAAFEPAFRDAYVLLMREKFGLRDARQGDVELMLGCLDVLHEGAVDYTTFFRSLCDLGPASKPDDDRVAALFANRDAWYGWQTLYRERIAGAAVDHADRSARMRRHNPKFVLRNYLAQQAIESAQKGDFDEIARLAGVLGAPFDEQPGRERYAATPPQWARHIEVGCSS